MNSTFQISCFTFLILVLSNSEAIVNLDSLHFDNANKKQSGKVSFGFNGASGNTRKSHTNFGAQYKISTEVYQHIFLANYQRGKSNNKLNTNKRFLHLRHIHATSTKRRSWEIYTQLESNAFTQLSLRTLVGGGLRYELNKKATHRHFVGIGGFYSRESLEGNLGTSTSTRVNLYLLSKVFANETTTLNNTLYYQPDISSASDLRAINVTSLNVKLGKQLTLKIYLQINHDSRPPLDVKQTDSSYTTAFEYTL